MTTPLWGHKPPAVPDAERYLTAPPTELSARCLYWLRRADEGHWRANRRFWQQSHEGRAALLGVSSWESRHILTPLMTNLAKDSEVLDPCTVALGHDVSSCCDACHAAWVCDGVYMCDGIDWAGRDLHTCCTAAVASSPLLKLVPWDSRLEGRR